MSNKSQQILHAEIKITAHRISQAAHLMIQESWFRNRNVEFVVGDGVYVAHAEQLRLCSTTFTTQSLSHQASTFSQRRTKHWIKAWF